MPPRKDERGWPRYSNLVSAFHSNVRIFGQNRRQRSNNLTLSRKDVVKCIDPNMVLSSSMLRSISSSILRSMTLVQLDAIELGLRFHRQFSASPRPDAHEIGVDHLKRTKPSVEVWILRAPRAFIEDLRVNQGCHTLVTLWSNPCASTERPARDFMVGAKLRKREESTGCGRGL